MSAPSPEGASPAVSECTEGSVLGCHNAKLWDLWRDGHLCDVAIRTADGDRTQAHKIVLAAASNYFRALFVGAGRLMHPYHGLCPDTGLHMVELNDVDGDSFRAILQGIYGQPKSVDAGNVESLLAASDYLGVESIRRLCCEFLRTRLQPENCLQTLCLAARYDPDGLYKHVANYVCSRFSEMTITSALYRWQDLPYHVLLDILQSEALTGPEEGVYEVVAAWLAADTEGRRPLLPELLATVRLPPDELAAKACSLSSPRRGNRTGAAVPGDDIRGHIRASEGGVGQAEERRSKADPGLRAVLVDGVAALCAQRAPAGLPACPPPRQSMPRGLLAAGGHDVGWRSLKSVEVYDAGADAWAAGVAMPACMPFAGGASAGGSVVLVGGSVHACGVLSLARGAHAWERAPPLTAPRVQLAVTALGSDVYVLGGRTGVGALAGLRNVDVLRAGAEAWAAAPPMCLPRASLAAAALGIHLYAVGGQDGKTVYSSTERYDPVTGLWEMLSASMLSERKYATVAALDGRLYAVGGMTGVRKRLASCEALDPRVGRWEAIAPMPTPRSSAGVAALRGCLYVVGGSGAQEFEMHDSTIAYSPAAGRWELRAPMAHARSSLALAAI